MKYAFRSILIPCLALISFNLPACSNSSDGGGGSAETTTAGERPTSDEIAGACFAEGGYLCTDYVGSGWQGGLDRLKDGCTQSHGENLSQCPKQALLGSCLHTTDNRDASYIWRYYKITHLEEAKFGCEQSGGQWQDRP